MSPFVTSAAAAGGEEPSRNLTAREATVAIDASARWPLVGLFVGGLGWLVVSTLLGIIAAIKLHAPGFLADSAWLTVGRVRPAAVNALVYGFCTPVGLGVLLWMLARLGGRRCLYPGAIAVATTLWNLGLLGGVAGVLAVGPTGFEWLEMPRFVPPLLLAAFLILAIGALLNYAFRSQPTGYVSQWYLVAALFWFAWVYTAGCHLLLYHPVRGVLQAAVNAWFTGNLLNLWLTPIGLAGIFYLIPQLTGRPLYSSGLAVFGFWTLALFGSWSALTGFIGGPLPRWMPGASETANVLLVVSVVAVAWNWHGTLQGEYHRLKTDLTLRFVFAGAVSYLLASAMSLVLGFSAVGAVTQLTLVPVARTQLVLHGFVALTLFGCLYHVLPRLLQVSWPSTALIRFHFLASVIGVGLMVAALTVGGLIQGIRMNNPNAEIVGVVRSTIPFLGNASLGLCVLLAGQVAFAWNVGRLLLQACRRNCPLTEFLHAVEAAEGGGAR